MIAPCKKSIFFLHETPLIKIQKFSSKLTNFDPQLHPQPQILCHTFFYSLLLPHHVNISLVFSSKTHNKHASIKYINSAALNFLQSNIQKKTAQPRDIKLHTISLAEKIFNIRYSIHAMNKDEFLPQNESFFLFAVNTHNLK